MNEQYIPLIHTPESGNFADINVITLQERIHNVGVTHVRTKQGKVWKIFQLLNKKSVPLNNGGDGPQRVNFGSVESFGVIQEEEPEPRTEETPPGETQNNPSSEVARTGSENMPENIPTGHQDRAHAILSASGAHRWINCTPSARLEEHLPDSTSEAAEQGTAAHELAEWKLRIQAGEAAALHTAPASHWHDEEMEDHTDNYVDYVTAELARTKESSPAAFLSIEERLDFSHLVPDGFGTGDAVIVGDGTMTIADLKYGKGVEVSAVENPQMMLYALGAINTYGMIYQIDRVRMVIFQPRRNNISVWETSVQDLLDWADTVVRPAAKLAYAGEGELRAGEWCQFCRHAPQCTALAAQHFQVIPEGTTAALEQKVTPPKPDTLTDDQVAQIVQHADDIKKWLTAVEKHALETANAGRQYPGLKLVEGRSVRRYGDEEAIAQAVTAAGHDPYEKKLIGITAMTKLLGKKQFDELVGGHLTKPAGAPTLVPDTDPRPALSVATPDTVFTPIQETP